MRTRTFFWIAGMLLLAACGGASGSAAGAVEQYFRTLVGKDEAKIVALACAEWEEAARADVLSFGENPATAEDIACRETGSADGAATIACTGKLVLDYGGDLKEVDLSKREYKAVLEDGAWRMCGYRQ